MKKRLAVAILSLCIIMTGSGISVLALEVAPQPRLACPWCGGTMKMNNRKLLYQENCPVVSGKKDPVYEYTYECRTCGELETIVSQVLCSHKN